jgi:Predicted permeases
MRHKTVKLKPGLVFALIGALGDYIGATLGLITPGKTLLLLFGVLMIIVALLMLRNNTATSQRQSTSWTRLTVTAFLVGIAAGYFGIGGGFLIVPGLMFSTSISIVEAISTSLLSVGTFGVVAALRYFLAGEVDFLIAALYLVGGVLGGYFGTKIEHSVPKRTLKLIFSAIVIVVALYLIYSNI